MRLFGGILLLFFCIAGLSQAVQEITPPAHMETDDILRARFRYAGLDYPPERVQLIALKYSRKLELWVWERLRWHHLHDYPVFAASGYAGPKLREGDRQVPEGFYRIDALNPNSRFHLSLKLDYPNVFDWRQAVREGRDDPGSNIFIHGSAWSAGCLAIGNRSIEELYSLVSEIGTEQAHVLIAPYDFRLQENKIPKEQPVWVRRLYTYLKARMSRFPLHEKLSECTLDCLLAQQQRAFNGSRQVSEE